MNSLESPLEALAFNYLSYGFLTAVNNIWAWIAVITAAVSFWRIRAVSTTSPPVPRCLSPDGASTSKPSQQPRNVLSAAAAAEPAAVSLSSSETMKNLSTETPKTTSCRVLEREGSTKMKFTVHYGGDDDCLRGGGGGVGGGDRGLETVNEKTGRWCDDWERTMVVRMGDMGWYRRQDLTVLDGSVVRLWEGHRRRSHAAAMVGSRAVTW